MEVNHMVENPMGLSRKVDIKTSEWLMDSKSMPDTVESQVDTGESQEDMETLEANHMEISDPSDQLNMADMVASSHKIQAHMADSKISVVTSQPDTETSEVTSRRVMETLVDMEELKNTHSEVTVILVVLLLWAVTVILVMVTLDLFHRK